MTFIFNIMNLVKLISFPFCNLNSVARCLQVMNYDYRSLVDPVDISISDTIILPESEPLVRV